MSVNIQVKDKGVSVNVLTEQIINTLPLGPEVKAAWYFVIAQKGVKAKFGLFTFRIDCEVEGDLVLTQKCQLPMIASDLLKSSDLIKASVAGEVAKVIADSAVVLVKHYVFSGSNYSDPGLLKEATELAINHEDVLYSMGPLEKKALINMAYKEIETKTIQKMMVSKPFTPAPFPPEPLESYPPSTGKPAWDFPDPKPVKIQSSGVTFATDLDPVPGITDVAKAVEAKAEKVVIETQAKKLVIDPATITITPVEKPKAKFLKTTTAKEKAAAKQAQAEVDSMAVIPLAEASFIGQRVKGTSGGSVYRCFAVGKINLATKIEPGSVAIRAEPLEGADWEAQKDKLKNAGFTDKGKYMSMHCTLTPGMPAMRVIGAVLFSLDLEFEDVGTTKGSLNA